VAGPAVLRERLATVAAQDGADTEAAPDAAADACPDRLRDRPGLDAAVRLTWRGDPALAGVYRPGRTGRPGVAVVVAIADCRVLAEVSLP